MVDTNFQQFVSSRRETTPREISNLYSDWNERYLNRKRRRLGDLEDPFVDPTIQAHMTVSKTSWLQAQPNRQRRSHDELNAGDMTIRLQHALQQHHENCSDCDRSSYIDSRCSKGRPATKAHPTAKSREINNNSNTWPNQNHLQIAPADIITLPFHRGKWSAMC